jgi:two-component system, NarL family, sensor histidine kinase EvgS
MIGNIAHQWRQPLSLISTASTGIIVQKEYGILNDNKLIETCNAINNNAQYLSKTIDDFRNFIKGDRIKTIFSLKADIDSFLHLVEGTIKNNQINIVLDLQEDIKIDGYENELTQCLINIFNNAKDILIKKDIFKKSDATLKNIDKLVFITTLVDKKNVHIKIKDNGGGIPKDIIDKVFEPYFTTKHQSQGTGLGLHMTYNLIVDGMGGKIKVVNQTYTYKGNEYTGAEFTISLPI